MRVGIYARGVSERSGGAKVYIYELTKALTEVIGAKDELFIFHNADKSVFSKKKNIHEVILKSKNKLYADFIEAPREINKLNLDVVLFLKNVIFYAGSISPRKNLKRLINAFNQVQDKIGHDLVITGNKLWGNKREMQMIKQNPRIKVLGFIPDEDLPILYNLASLYVYPSLYEGFGLPILEAQASGCPVISSNASSLPEVAGKGALYFDPEKEGEIAKMILKLAGDDKLKDKLVKIGFENIKKKGKVGKSYSERFTNKDLPGYYQEIEYGEESYYSLMSKIELEYLIKEINNESK